MKPNTVGRGGETPASSEDVEVRVLIAARPEVIFRYFADPERYRSWMGSNSTIEPRRGGELTVSFGPGPTAVGRIEEWIPNQRLVFTWGHRPGDSGATVAKDATRVTITLEPKPDGTLVTLRHSGLPTEQDREGHRGGWRYYLSQLSAVSWKERMEGRREALVDAYVAAWNTSDDAKRAALLAQCWSEAGRYRDRYGCIDGRDALHGYIGGVLRMMQGAKLERSGAIEQTHGFLRYPWKVTLPNGATMATGVNFFELDSEGRLQTGVGFWDSAPAG